MRHKELQGLINDFKNGLQQREFHSKKTLLQKCEEGVSKLSFTTKEKWKSHISYLAKELERKKYEYEAAKSEIDESASDVSSAKEIHMVFMGNVFKYIEITNEYNEAVLFLPLVKKAFVKWSRTHRNEMGNNESPKTTLVSDGQSSDANSKRRLFKYSYPELALKFIDTYDQTSKELPTQRELEAATGINQSVWSRVMNKKEFWVIIHKTIDNEFDTMDKKLEEKKEKRFHLLKIALDNRDKNEWNSYSIVKHRGKEVGERKNREIPDYDSMGSYEENNEEKAELQYSSNYIEDETDRSISGENMDNENEY